MTGKLANNSLLYLLTTIFLKGFTFLVLPFYTRLISPVEYGEIYLITTLSTFLSLLASLSTRGAINRYYFDNKESQKLKEMYSSLVYATFFISTVFFVGIFFFAQDIVCLMGITNNTYLYVGLTSSFLGVFYPLIVSLLYAQQNGKLISLITIVVGVVGILVQLALVINLNDKIQAYLISLLVNSLLQFFLFCWFSKKYLTLHIDWKKLKEYLRYSINTLPSDMSVWVITFADRLMVNKIKGHSDTGLYTIGYQIGQIPEVLFTSVNQAYTPYVFDKFSRWNAKEKKELIKVSTYLFILFTGCVFILSVFAKEIVSLLDEKYNNSFWVVIIILFSYLLSGYRVVFHNPSSYIKKYVKYKSRIWLLAASLNIGLNIFLIPRYSYTGAAIATFIAYAISFVLMLVISNRAIRINYPVKKFVLVFIVGVMYAMNIFWDIGLKVFLFKVISTILFITFLVKQSDLDIKAVIGVLKSRYLNG
jgi:O-antigen/teichoic acid export membrane protein